MNIYDIAREAGVSIATVSRVLNHKDTVRADTRAKVEKVLKRCNYAPSAIAQGMVSKSLHTVAVLTVDIRDSHYARTAYTIEREFGRRGYEVILCNTLSKISIWEIVHFDAIFIGDDWKGNARWIKTEKELAPLDVDVVYLPHTDGICSTFLRAQEQERIKE